MKIISKKLIFSFTFVLYSFATIISSEPTKTVKINSPVKDFELWQVKLSKGPFAEAEKRNIALLKSYDLERLLVNFRKNAGIPTTTKEYSGLESSDSKNDGIRGSFLGYYISALSMSYATNGDKELKKRIDYLIIELSKCQKKNGNGYVGALKETIFDDINAGKSPTGAPWQTMQTLFTGLYDAYNYAGNGEVYAILMQLSDWAKKKTDVLSEIQMQSILATDCGGISKIMSNFYAITQNPSHLLLAKRFEHQSFLKTLSTETDNLSGLDASIQLEKILGAARLYEITGDINYRKSCEYFWDCVVNHRTNIIGGTGVLGKFTERNAFFKYHTIAEQNEIECAYDLLQLTNKLFQWTGDIKYAEYYERTLINSILSAQSNTKFEKTPEGLFSHYLPTKSGLYKRFGSIDNSFWSSLGIGMKSMTELGRFIYSYDNEGIIINLFVASELSWVERKYTIKQESAFPEQESSKITMQVLKPLKMKIKIRIPSWTKNCTFKLNGNAKKFVVVGNYAECEKVWESKDIIEVSYPMTLQKVTMTDNTNMIGITYGPMVLSGKLDNKGLTKVTLFGTTDVTYSNQSTNSTFPTFKKTTDDINTWIQAIDNKPFTFQTTGQNASTNIVLEPFYKQFFERYILYWEMKE